MIMLMIYWGIHLGCCSLAEKDWYFVLVLDDDLELYKFSFVVFHRSICVCLVLWIMQFSLATIERYILPEKNSFGG